MPKKFRTELKSLKKEVLKMGELSQKMLCKSVQALKDQDEQKADWVLSQKEKIAVMDEEIEQKALKLIALHQPFAKDLRTIACSLKMITYLARVGRYGKDIAQIAKDLSGKPHIAKLVSIPYMSDIVCGMIKDALEAYEKEDLTHLEDIAEREDNVDSLRYSIFRESISYMVEDPKNINRCTNYIMVSRYLERCGDHACKMAEKINYLVTGERVEIR
jgi:phosphate transport system protein